MSDPKLAARPRNRHTPGDVRARRLASAAAARSELTDADAIAWDAPELADAFARVCSALDWEAFTSPAFRAAREELRDRGAWNVALLTPDTAATLWAALNVQLDDARLAALEAELEAALARHWAPGVRVGIEWLRETFVDDVIEARCETREAWRGAPWNP